MEDFKMAIDPMEKMDRLEKGQLLLVQESTIVANGRQAGSSTFYKVLSNFWIVSNNQLTKSSRLWSPYFCLCSG